RPLLASFHTAGHQAAGSDATRPVRVRDLLTVGEAQDSVQVVHLLLGDREDGGFPSVLEQDVGQVARHQRRARRQRLGWRGFSPRISANLRRSSSSSADRSTGTTTSATTIMSPRPRAPNRPIPSPGMRVIHPGWVPAGSSTVVVPPPRSGTSTSVPSAASARPTRAW